MRHETFYTFGMISGVLLFIAASTRAETAPGTLESESKPLSPDASNEESGPPAPAQKVPDQPSKKIAPKVESPVEPSAEKTDIETPRETKNEPEGSTFAPSEQSATTDEAAQADATKETEPVETNAQAETEPAKSPATSVLKVETSPPGAVVTIGYSDDTIDQEMGETPIILQVLATTYYVSLRKEGYETATAKVTVKEGETSWLRVRLEHGVKKRVRAVRIAGNLVFWPGLATAVAGIILIVLDDPGKDRNTGKPGFGLVGAGVTMVIAGGLMLGLTYRDRGVYTMPDAKVAATAPRFMGKRGTLTLTKSF